LLSRETGAGEEGEAWALARGDAKGTRALQAQLQARRTAENTTAAEKNPNEQRRRRNCGVRRNDLAHAGKESGIPDHQIKVD
jgi:hypothetical protein